VTNVPRTIAAGGRFEYRLLSSVVYRFSRGHDAGLSLRRLLIIMPNTSLMGTSGSKDIENKDNAQEGNVSQWAELLTQLVDKITGKDVSITYRFDNLQINVPKATGPNGRELGSAKWNINGKVVIHSQLENKDSS
jgi:hypothetical protein